MVRPPLVITGGPAVGKSTTAGWLARARSRAAVIDVDDVRLMVVAGHVPPWQGEEGLAQQRLGVQNACGLARRFAAHGFDVVIADVLTPGTALLYRAQLPECLIVRLQVTLTEAHRRAETRIVHLTDEEFVDLHTQDHADPPSADHHLEVTPMSVDEQAAAVAVLWLPDRT